MPAVACVSRFRYSSQKTLGVGNAMNHSARQAAQMSSPPGPKNLLLHLLEYFRQPLVCYQKLSARYGQPFSVPFPLGGRMTVSGCPLHIEKIFKGGAVSYRSVDASAGMFYGENSLMSMEGEVHARMRRAMMAPILRRPKNATALIRDAALDAFESQGEGLRFEMLGKARSITLDVILGTVFGIPESEERLQFIAAVHALHGTIGFFTVFFKALRRDWGPYSPWGRFVRARAHCYALIEAKIAEVRIADDNTDDSVLAYWVRLKDKDGQPVLSDAEIRDNLLTLLFAGHDSTAVALAWCFYWTHREPGVLTALFDELRDYAATLDVERLQDTPYLDAVCYEALRMHPIAPGVARRLGSAFELGGYTVPESDVLMACFDLACHDPELYPDPKRFFPERFLKRQYGAAEFFPFGGGERRCPGAVLALTEMRVVLATLICRYRFRLLEKRPLDAIWSYGIRRPKTGVSMQLLGDRH